MKDRRTVPYSMYEELRIDNMRLGKELHEQAARIAGTVTGFGALREAFDEGYNFGVSNQIDEDSAWVNSEAKVLAESKGPKDVETLEEMRRRFHCAHTSPEEVEKMFYEARIEIERLREYYQASQDAWGDVVDVWADTPDRKEFHRRLYQAIVAMEEFDGKKCDD